jgi:Uma2 family endonuclease
LTVVADRGLGYNAINPSNCRDPEGIMSTITQPLNPPRPIVYPESDGQPMAENTLQFQWIVTVKEGLTVLFRDREDVFVAGDLLWYPVEGDNKTRVAPDAMVAFGRPQGHRGSYLQWKEGGIPPQVVFEILSPGNRQGEMIKKFQFYEHHGVLEYYIYDPDNNKLEGWHRPDRQQPFSAIAAMAGWTSPLLGITFDWSETGFRLIRPDGRPFETFEEVVRRAEAAEAAVAAQHQRAETERQRAEAERRRAEAENRRAEAERVRADEAVAEVEKERRRAEEDRETIARLEARLRELGGDLDR